jgi:hypothetical protein
MYTFFLFCAVIAGTIFLLQFVLLLIGFGAEGAGLDVDMHDGSGADFGGHMDAGHGAGHGGADHGHDAGHHHSNHASTWLFGVISLRTVIAAVTFFGLAGMAMVTSLEESVTNNIYAFLVATAAGAAAMFGVHFLMRSLHKLGQDGTLRMRDAIGRAATVYVSIPASGTGAGKIQIRMPGGLQEMAATTGVNQTLATGTKVRVVSVVGGGTVRVEPMTEKANVEAAS